MKRIELILLFGFFLFSTSLATELKHEQFDYTAGQNLGDQLAWTNLNSGDEIIISSNSLTYSGINSAGNKVSFDGDGYDPYTTFTSQTSGVIYGAFLVKVTDISSFTSDGYYAGFASGATTFGSTVWFIKVSGQDKVKIGLHRRSGETPDQTDATEFNLNTTIYIVISYEFNASGDDEAKLWINPTPGQSEPPAADLTSIAGTTELSSISRFFLRQDSSTETPAIEFDELRIATTWSEATLPIELSTFTAQYLNNIPTLYWVTQSETDNIGWYIYRNIQNDFITSIIISDLIPGYGTTTEPHSYIYEDYIENVLSGYIYWYWLESIDFGGTFNHYDKVAHIVIPENYDPGNENPEEFEEFGLFQSNPNPFNPRTEETTEISFNLKEQAYVEINIYNIKGELVKTIYDGFNTTDEVVWDGKDGNGNLQATGIYLYELKVNNKMYSTKRIILIR